MMFRIKLLWNGHPFETPLPFYSQFVVKSWPICLIKISTRFRGHSSFTATSHPNYEWPDNMSSTVSHFVLHHLYHDITHLFLLIYGALSGLCVPLTIVRCITRKPISSTAFWVDGGAQWPTAKLSEMMKSPASHYNMKGQILSKYFIFNNFVHFGLIYFEPYLFCRFSIFHAYIFWNFVRNYFLSKTRNTQC